MGVRAYTPKLARFTTPDPVGLKAGWNQHDALAGDPVNMIDADGRFAIVVPMVVVGGAAVLGWLSTRNSDPETIGTAATDLFNAADRAGDALWNVLDECIDFADGDDSEDLAGTKGKKTSEAKAAQQTGLTEEQVRDAIHDLKDGMPGGGSNDRRNPDVHVGPNGEVYPLGPGGVLGDSLGNLNDYK